jgi:hypothetical protein
MAEMFHLHAQIIRRSEGRSVTAAAAYRSASRITDQRTGQTFDYTRKRQVHPLPLYLPEGTPPELADRSSLWNAIEAHNKREDAQVGREIEVAIPHGLPPADEVNLIDRFGRWLVRSYSIGVDACIHRPPGNHHAHLLTTTSSLGPKGIGAKVRALDQIACKKGNAGATSPIEAIREEWEALVNETLAESGRHIDRRTLAEQGIDRLPQRHQGPAATAMARRGAQANRARNPRPQSIQEEFNEPVQQFERNRCQLPDNSHHDRHRGR